MYNIWSSTKLGTLQLELSCIGGSTNLFVDSVRALIGSSVGTTSIVDTIGASVLGSFDGRGDSFINCWRTMM